MLLYGERIGAGVRAVVPPGDGSPEDDFPTRIQGAVFGYVRGQLLFSLIMGTSAGVVPVRPRRRSGSSPTARRYALAFGAFYGFAELIPYIGPAVGAFPPVIIALFSGDPLDALWLAIMFTALQQIEGHVVAPQRVRPRAAHQPAAGDLRAAARRAALRLPRRVHRAADRGDRCARRSSTCAATSRSSRGRAPAAVARRRGRDRGRRAARSAGAGVAPGVDAVCPACGTELGDADEAAIAACRRAVVDQRRSGVSQALRRAARAARASRSRPSRGERIAIIGPNGAGKTTLLQILAGVAAADAAARVVARPTDGRLGAAAAGALLEALGGREPAPVRAAGEGRRRRRRGRADARADRPARPRRRRGRQALGRQPPAGEHRRSACSRSPPVAAARRAVVVARPAPARAAVGRSSAASPRRGTTVVYSTHNVGEAERYADRVLVLADGELLFSGTPARARAAVGRREPRLRGAPSCASSTSAGH